MNRRNVGDMRFIVVDRDKAGEGWTLADFIVNNTNAAPQGENDCDVSGDISIDDEVLMLIDALLDLDVGGKYTHDGGAHGVDVYKRER